MSDKVREFAEIPQQFIRDGNQVRLYVLFCALANVLLLVSYPLYKTLAKRCIALKSWWSTNWSQYRTEFTQICKAVAIGFAVMGFIGYLVKLIHIPM